jgi:hypothetical protein
LEREGDGLLRRAGGGVVVGVAAVVDGERVSLPALRLLTGMVIVALPLVSVTAEELYPPLERVTVPVGVAPEPETATVTCRLVAVVMLAGDGVTLTIAVRPLTTSDCAALPAG